MRQMRHGDRNRLRRAYGDAGTPLSFGGLLPFEDTGLPPRAGRAAPATVVDVGGPHEQGPDPRRQRRIHPRGEPVVFTKIAFGAIALGTVGVTTPAVVMMTNASHQGSDRTLSAGASGAKSGGSGTQASERRDRDHVHVILRNARGGGIGYVDLTSSEGATQVSVRAWDLTPGFHGFHIHAAGVCDPGGTAPFASAGGHFNPTGTAEGMQAGAFPVLLAGKDGTASADFRDGNVTLSQLFGPSGTSIVVHAMPDN